MSSPTPPPMAHSASSNSVYFTPRNRMSPSLRSPSPANSVSSRVEMFEARAATSSNHSSPLLNGSSPRPSLSARGSFAVPRPSIAELWPGEIGLDRRESKEELGEEAIIAGIGLGLAPARGLRDFTPTSDESVSTTKASFPSSASGSLGPRQTGPPSPGPSRIPQRTPVSSPNPPSRSPGPSRGGSLQQLASNSPSRIPTSRSPPRPPRPRDPVASNPNPMSVNASVPPLGASHLPLPSDQAVDEAGRSVGMDSRRSSFQIDPATGSRRLSAASLGSPGRRPKGPRPSHKSRSSITSMSSVASDATSAGASASASASASEAERPTSRTGGPGGEPSSNRDENVVGASREFTEDSLSPGPPRIPQPIGARSPSMKLVRPAIATRTTSRDSLVSGGDEPTPTNRTAAAVPPDRTEGDVLGTVPPPGARRASQNVMLEKPTKSPIRPKMDPARRPSAAIPSPSGEILSPSPRKVTKPFPRSPSDSSSPPTPNPTQRRGGVSVLRPGAGGAGGTSPTSLPSPTRPRRPANRSTVTPPRQSPRGSPRSTPKSSPKTSPRPPSTPTLSSPPSRLERKSPGGKSPGLTIKTGPPPAAPTAHRPPSTISVASDRPSPPVPAKNPLRRLSRTPSGLADRPAVGRSVSGESTAANAGTPTTIQEHGSPVGQDESVVSPVDSTRPVSSASTAPRTPLSPESSSSTSERDRTAPASIRNEEVRFTSMTTASMYSQYSEPSSARSTLTGTSLGEGTVGSLDALQPTALPSRHTSFGWGKKRQGVLLEGLVLPGGNRLSQSELPALEINDKQLPQTPKDTPTTATTDSTRAVDSALSTHAVSGHALETPQTPTVAQRRLSTRSPSMPLLGLGTPPTKVARILGVDVVPPVRAVTDPPLLPPVMLRSPTTANVQTLPTSPSRNTMSKRAHLIREIATSERAYANDLALVRDAFLPRHHLRPTSHHSAGTNGDSTLSPGNISDRSRRSSIYTYQTAETKRSSGHSLSGPWNGSGPTTPLPKSPSDVLVTNGGPYGYFPPSSTASATSLSTQPQPSPRHSSHASTPQLGGKSLSPADMRNVFLNLDQLATAADELATEFERAIGDDEPGPGVEAREGEGGSDRLGEVFTAMASRIRPLFLYYCARQATASARLVELQGDRTQAAYLKDCWSLIKPHTHAWNLDSMLIKPVQRITKYPLLFDDLLSSTTPVHPDYFNIRSASEVARSMALEIDEAKRRKDVVAGAIRKTPVLASKENKPGKAKGLKLFRKDKAGASSVTLASLSSDPGAPADIPPTSLSFYREQVARLEEIDMCVRRVGKEMVLWTSAAREVFVAEEALVKSWGRVVQLDMSDPADKRLAAFRKISHEIVAEVWAGLVSLLNAAGADEKNEEVTEQIIPTLSKLLHTADNPRRVIARRDAKASDYARYQALHASKKQVDRVLVDSAKDFVALHAQLVEDLPPFMEGYMRIFDLALVAFGRAQAAYFQGVQDGLTRFVHLWIAKPRRPSATATANVVSLDDQEAVPDISTGRGIVKAWHDAWAPYAEAMEHFECTRPSRIVSERMRSFNARPGSRNTSQPGSRSNSPTRTPSRPELRHSNSVTSHRSLRGETNGNTDRRPRSTSMLGSQGPMSPGSEKTFKLLRTSSRPTAATVLGAGLMLPPPSPSGKTLRPDPTPTGDPSNRWSFGLPRISPVSDFDALGLARIRTPGTPPRTPRTYYGRTPSSASVVSDFGGIGMSEFGRMDATRSKGTSNYDFGSSRERTIRLVGSTKVPSPSLPGFGLSAVDDMTRAETFGTSGTGFQRHHHPKRTHAVEDAGDGWRNEPVLYQCAAVADFDPSKHGEKRYRKLRFLPIITGDLIDVFYEVGRIDELPSFPYVNVGVDNDGVLVGRTENGDIGLVICSFLEPLTA